MKYVLLFFVLCKSGFEGNITLPFQPVSLIQTPGSILLMPRYSAKAGQK
jgi:hypothetical protein